MIAYGREGYKWPVNALYLASNTLVNDHSLGGAFLRVAPGYDRVYSVNNLLVGKGGYHVDEHVTENDKRGDWSHFIQPARHDYRLSPKGKESHFQLPRQVSEGLSLIPVFEYAHPRQLRRLITAPDFAGAIQTSCPEMAQQTLPNKNCDTVR